MGCCGRQNLIISNNEEIKNEFEIDISIPKLTNKKNENSNNFIEKLYEPDIKKDSSLNSSLLSNNKAIPNVKISKNEYEEILNLYPNLNPENKIEIKKNVLLKDKCLFYGEYNNDKKIKEGRGILIYPNGCKYTGYFQNDKQNIRGKMEHVDGDVYEGDWVDNKANGKGQFIHNGIIYNGFWKDDKQNGTGIEKLEDIYTYEGDFVNGKKEGKGKYIWSDGSSYEGDFKDNGFNGKGIFIWKNGRTYEGDWEYNKMKGKGIFTWPDGRKYSGYWKNGVQDGEGEVYDPKRNNTKKGLWKNGKNVKWIN